MRPYARWLKRPLDATASLVALLVLSPVLIAIAVVVRLTSRGPVIFRQTRVGRAGRPFTMYKFRTMRVNAPDLWNPDGTTYNAHDDPRVTLPGRFLRRSSLDELPQLFNVLLGEMSLVGGRPDLPEGVRSYLPHQRDRLLVRPGLTSWAMLHGRNNVPVETRRDLDAWYANHVGLLLDLRILLGTVRLVLTGEGVINDYSRRNVASTADVEASHDRGAS